MIRWLYARPLGDVAGDVRHLNCPAAAGQEHLWHAGAPADCSRIGWMGSWMLNDVVSISYIRIAIFVSGADFSGTFPLHHEADPARA